MKYIVTLNGKNYEVDVTETEAEIISVTDVAPVAAAPVQVAAAPVAAAPAPAAPAQVAGPGEKVVSPMPGTILSCNISVGQSVKSGEVLFVLEAMKMENEIVAPCDGTVKQVLAQKGSAVDTDAVLAVI